MTATGSVHPTHDKSQIRQLIEELPEKIVETPTVSTPDKKSCLIIDGMAVVHELMAVTNLKTCHEFGDAYVNLIETRGKCYEQVRVIFDDYTQVASLKERTREQRRGK